MFPISLRCIQKKRKKKIDGSIIAKKMGFFWEIWTEDRHLRWEWLMDYNWIWQIDDDDDVMYLSSSFDFSMILLGTQTNPSIEDPSFFFSYKPFVRCENVLFFVFCVDFAKLSLSLFNWFVVVYTISNGPTGKVKIISDEICGKWKNFRYSLISNAGSLALMNMFVLNIPT